MSGMSSDGRKPQVESDVLKWRDRGGAIRSFTAADQLLTRRLAYGRAWSVPLRVEKQANRTGDYYFTRTRQHVAYASLLEASLLLLLDFQLTAVAVLSQPFQMHFRRGSKRIKHIPDFFVLRATGEQEVWDVRPYGRIDGKLKEGAALTREFCASVGFAYYLFDDVNMAVRRNLEWLHAYADGRYAPDAPRRAELRRFFEATGQTIGSAIQHFADSPPQIRMWVFHLLWHRELSFDIESPLSDFRVIRGGD